jgi:hypothetical protein
MGFLIREVYNALPCPIKELICSKPRATCGKLSSAVLTLNTSDLKEATANYLQNEEMACLACLTCEPPSPTKAIHEAHTSTHLHDVPHQYNAPAPIMYGIAP